MTSKWPERQGAKCSECPLRGSDPVPCEQASLPPKFAVVLSGPGPVENKKQVPLTGKAGWLFNETLTRYQIDREEVHLTHATLCMPQERLGPREWRKAIACCKPRLENELPEGTPILAMGGFALSSLVGYESLKAWRGYPLQYKDTWVYGTWAPDFVLQKSFYLPGWLTDWERFQDFLEHRLEEWKWPKRLINENQQMLTALQQLSNAPYVGVDIEGSGMDPFSAFIRCLGLATTEIAVSVPWPSSWNSITTAALKVLRDPTVKKVLHNGNFDLVAFEALGIECNNFTFDTLVAHHVVAPQMAHDLGEVASIEYPAPRWKSEFKVTDDRKGSAFWEKVDPEALRLYNCGDALMTAKLYKPLKKRISEAYLGEKRFTEAMKICHIQRMMTQKGFLVDQDARESHRKVLINEIEQLKEQIHAATPGLDLECEEDAFNPRSTQQLAGIFFDTFGCKARSFTATGRKQIDASVLEEILSDKEDPAEARALAKLILQYRKRDKLLGTYITGLPVSSDGRVHPTWKATTISGRWNSSGPNLQNQPKKLRDMYVAAPGNTLVAADFGQAEPRVQALRAPEPVLIDRFNNDPDFDYHSFFTAMIFGIPESEFNKDNEDHARLRQINKIITLGSSYGGGARGLHKQVAVRAPDFSLKQIERVLAKKKALFPNLERRGDADIQQAKDKGYIDLPFGAGRFYYYLGRADVTQIKNLPQQGGVAKIVNDVTRAIADRLDWSCEAIVASVHDELVLEGPDEKRLIRILCEEMPQVKRIGKYEMNFPISIDVGTAWGKMEEIGTVRKGESL